MASGCLRSLNLVASYVEAVCDELLGRCVAVGDALARRVAFDAACITPSTWSR